MKKILSMLALLLVFCTSACAKDIDVSARVKEARSAVERMMASNDAAGFARSVRDGVGIAIFPSVIKAGLIVGGRYGEGLLMYHDRKKGEWYGPAFFSIAGGSYGLQIGASSTALVLTVNTDDAMEVFRGGTFKLGADVTAAAGPGGRDSSVALAGNVAAPMYSYSVSKGVFAGVSVDGSVISELPRVNDACWGQHLNNIQILSRKSSRNEVLALIRTLDKLIAQVK